MSRCSDDRPTVLAGLAVRTRDPDGVAAVLQAMPQTTSAQEFGVTVGLLPDSARMRLQVALSNGERCDCRPGATCGRSKSGDSDALRLLRAHRLITGRRSRRLACCPHVHTEADVRMELALALHDLTVPATTVAPATEGR